MKQSIVMGIVAAALVFNAAASVRKHPYGIIVERNPFGLKPAPVVEQPRPEPPPEPLLPEIKITGITTLLGAPMVTLQYEDKEAKKVEFPPLLKEGERYKTLLVKKIDTVSQTVVIRNGDILETLDFIHDGVKPAVSRSASPPPVSPNVSGKVANRAPDNRVIVRGAALPGASPPPRPVMTPEEIRARLDALRPKQQVQGQRVLVHPTGVGRVR